MYSDPGINQRFPGVGYHGDYAVVKPTGGEIALREAHRTATKSGETFYIYLWENANDQAAFRVSAVYNRNIGFTRGEVFGYLQDAYLQLGLGTPPVGPEAAHGVSHCD